jgi:hypothetical protein
MRAHPTRNISLPDVPVGNYAIMLLVSATFMLQFVYDGNQQYLTGLILQDWSFKAIVGHMWLHAAFLSAFLTFSSLATSIITPTCQVVEGVVHVISIPHVDRIPVT